MEFIKPGINLDFVGKRYIAMAISAAFIVISFVSLIIKGGPNFGIDFAGGLIVQVKLKKDVKVDAIRKVLLNMGLKEATVQSFGDTKEKEFLIRLSMKEGLSDLSNSIRNALEHTLGKGSVEVRRVEMVGPKVGKDLRKKALLAIFYSLLFIAIYISGRFELKWFMSAIMAFSLMGAVYFASLINISLSYLILLALLITLLLCWFLNLKYALGAIVALIHDVTITVGVFSITNKEFNLSTVAALLTIIGYSLNDTIIVFDRIRENIRRYRQKNFPKVINRSINETLSRTILTSLTTLVVVISLYVLGGGVIKDFAFALIVGIVVGTYSSIYVASPILLFTTKKGLPKRK